MGRGPQKKA